MTRLFALAEEVAPLLTGQWRYNRLAETRSDIRHANEAVLNDDTQPGWQIVLRPCWDMPGRLQIRGSLPQSMSRVKITVCEQRPARAVAGDINRNCARYSAGGKDHDMSSSEPLEQSTGGFTLEKPEVL